MLTPSMEDRGVMLDSPPQRPPGGQIGSMMDLQSSVPTGGLGAMANTPAIQTMQGMAMIRNGINMITAANPISAQPLAQILSVLEQVVPRMMADQASPGVGPPGMVPPMTPPPGPPMGGPGGPPGGAPPMGAPPPGGGGPPPRPMGM